MTPEAIDQLFEDQLAVWPDLRNGVASLTRTRTREFEIRGVRVVALHIPHRMGSTTAPVDPEAIRNRPCFLCRENLPPEQQGIAFGDEWTVLFNPFPILERHVTLVYRSHIPQQIVGPTVPVVRDMLAAAAALPGYVVIYNGPRCGASAPDHLHFQACLPKGLPVIEDLRHARDRVGSNYLRSVLVVSGKDAREVEADFERLMARLSAHASDGHEPMVNVIALYDLGRPTLLVFPRARHRPRVYHEGRLTWSPGAIDMGGAVVLPADGDLERITADDIEAVFKEVSLPVEIADRIASGSEVP